MEVVKDGKTHKMIERVVEVVIIVKSQYKKLPYSKYCVYVLDFIK